MLTVFEGKTYEWEPPLVIVPSTPVLINGAIRSNFAAIATMTNGVVADVLMDAEYAALNPAEGVS